MSDFKRVGAEEYIATMQQMFAEILAAPAGSQERRVLEHKRAEFMRAHAKGERSDESSGDSE